MNDQSGNRSERIVPDTKTGELTGFETACANSVALLVVGGLLLWWFSATETGKTLLVYQTTDCEVIESESQYEIEYFTNARTRVQRETYHWKIHIKIAYSVLGQRYESTPYANYPHDVLDRRQVDNFVDRFPVGTRTTCRYSPEDPATAILVFHKIYWLWWSPVWCGGLCCIGMGVTVFIAAIYKKQAHQVNVSTVVVEKRPKNSEEDPPENISDV